ncbi:autotransporter outer membrane beta-barrel domain-containing protein [Serratia marcescens]|uniref:autotransporter outer membrane beta-barrel domain-containing protein n=1 Tax=Serratia marcescens TaxID=615 RepID=UPI003F875999
MAESGGVVSPGIGIGTLSVDGDAFFEPGSVYDVEVGSGNRSDLLNVNGQAVLNGGSMQVRLENHANLLTETEAESLLGSHYTVLTAADGLFGHFDNVAPAYPFIDIAADYQSNGVGLDIRRSALRFDSVPLTDNEREVARAVEALGADQTGPANVSHPVYESFLAFTSAEDVRQATRQLSGQVHADIASAQLNDSRQVRETLVGRLRQAEGLGAYRRILGYRTAQCVGSAQ